MMRMDLQDSFKKRMKINKKVLKYSIKDIWVILHF